ncbi:MAG TPA: MFS transporter [Microvirga sp.]|jgi:MFS family permease|nr:MFS transporter [Microvirga sp.]
MATDTGFTSEQKASLTAAVSLAAAVGVGLSLTIPLLSLEMERMGLSGGWIGANTAVAGVASLVVVPFVPRLASHFGVLPLLWASVGLVVASILGFRLLYSFAWWFPLRFTFSSALGVLFVLSEYWINTAAPPARRGYVMGIYATVLALGFAAGPGILSLVGTSGWPPYLVGAGLFALAALPLLLARGLSPEVGHGTGRTVASFLVAAPAATLAALVFGALETGAFALLPIYALRIGFEAENAAILVTAVAAGNVVFQIPIGLLSDRVDRRLVLLTAAAAGLIGAVLVPPLSGNTPALLAVLFFWGGLTGALYTVGLAHLGARFTGADLASANAAFVILYNMGLIVGPPMVGFGMDAAPPHGFAWMLAAFCGVYVAVVLGRMFTVERSAKLGQSPSKS